MTLHKLIAVFGVCCLYYIGVYGLMTTTPKTPEKKCMDLGRVKAGNLSFEGIINKGSCNCTTASNQEHDPHSKHSYKVLQVAKIIILTDVVLI